jgi:hypothetical protein
MQKKKKTKTELRLMKSLEFCKNEYLTGRNSIEFQEDSPIINKNRRKQNIKY